MRRLLISGQESEESDLGFLAFSRLDHPEIHLLFTDSLELELTRGELPTALSKPLCACTKLEGAKYFIRILDALGERPFIRGYSWRDAGDRQNVFSHLLKVCRPQNDDAEEFRNMLKARPIKPKRLLEAAMYSPAWLEIVGEYLNIPELPLAGWYFHAHVNENFSAEKETAVARYSSISPQEFNDGAFDIDWFHEAYNAVGPEMFSRLYDAAKYISGGANHRRSQIFADAAGKAFAQQREQLFRLAFAHQGQGLVKFGDDFPPLIDITAADAVDRMPVGAQPPAQLAEFSFVHGSHPLVGISAPRRRRKRVYHSCRREGSGF